MGLTVLQNTPSDPLNLTFSSISPHAQYSTIFISYYDHVMGMLFLHVAPHDVVCTDISHKSHTRCVCHNSKICTNKFSLLDAMSYVVLLLLMSVGKVGMNTHNLQFIHIPYCTFGTNIHFSLPFILRSRNNGMSEYIIFLEYSMWYRWFLLAKLESSELNIYYDVVHSYVT